MPVAAVLALGGGVEARTGLTVELKDSERVYAFLAGLRPNALVAGWPVGIIENVPYVSRRQIFLSLETHVAAHTAYVEEMRRRTRALTAATFATDCGPLTSLRDVFRVTHLVVDLTHVGSRPPTYIQPFTSEVRDAYLLGARDGFVIPRVLPAAAAFRDDDVVVLDLANLSVSCAREAVAGDAHVGPPFRVPGYGLF